MNCATCKNVLDMIADRQKSTRNLWKNCQRCRDKRTSISRRKRGLSPVQRPENRIDGDARPKQRTKRPVSERHDSTSTPNLDELGSTKETTYPRSERPNSTPHAYSFTSRAGITNLGGLNTTPELPRAVSSSFTGTTECSVCSEEYPADDIPRLENCLHEPRVCQDCFANWLKSQVGNTSWDRIVCPSDGCGVLVSHEEMKRLASDATYARYISATVSLHQYTTNALLGMTNCLPGAFLAASQTSDTVSALDVTLGRYMTVKTRATSSAAWLAAFSYVLPTTKHFMLERLVRPTTSARDVNAKSKMTPV
jgi:hypothetical protein